MINMIRSKIYSIIHRSLQIIGYYTECENIWKQLSDLNQKALENEYKIKQLEEDKTALLNKLVEKQTYIDFLTKELYKSY